tara:strand:+ start:693 stop:1091 length:399 start_codon:yes stop_codon:yes gene_type:complete
MEVSKWKRRRFIPTWGDNHLEEDPCVIIYAPPSVGWMARWREIAISAPEISPEKASEPGFVEKVRGWSEGMQDFRSEMLDDLVLCVEGLTLNGKAIDRSEAIEFIMDNEGLRDEVFAAILAEGVLTKGEGKS